MVFWLKLAKTVSTDKPTAVVVVVVVDPTFPIMDLRSRGLMGYDEKAYS